MLANSLAELIGLGTSALLWLGVLFNDATKLGIVAAAILVILGSTLLEGSAVGLGQWLVLRGALPGLQRRQWWLATTVGAFVAWTLGMIPSTMMSLAEETAASQPAAEISDALVFALAAAMGAALGPVLALPQWWVLRRYLARAGWWIPANAAAWALGMPVIFMGINFMPAGGVTPLTILIVLLTLATAGAIVGSIHGAVLVRLLRQP